jgi:hypothetical protein
VNPVRAVVAEVLGCLNVSLEAAPAQLRNQFKDWPSATPADVHVKETSGFGGSTTYKMTLGDTAVCVHIYGEKFAGVTPVDDRFKSRLQKAQGVLSAAGQ